LEGMRRTTKTKSGYWCFGWYFNGISPK